MTELGNEAPSQRDNQNNPRGGRRYNAPRPLTSTIVARPPPFGPATDARTFQINQLRRRYSTEETSSDDDEGKRNLKFKLSPSDPDFPYELQFLECLLTVPKNYPIEKPTLRILNQDMGRGYQINIEKGFDDIMKRMPKGTLLQYFNRLDQSLEQLLGAPKADTLKFVPHERSKNAQSSRNTGEQSRSSLVGTNLSIQTSKTSSTTPPRSPVYSQEQLAIALSKRELETRSLESRLGRLAGYSKSASGLTYTIPVDPPRRNELPESLRSIKTVKIVVPEIYDLEPCRLELPGVSYDEALILQDNFQTSMRESPNSSLVANINRLVQRMHIMAIKPAEKREATHTVPTSNTTALSDPVEINPGEGLTDRAKGKIKVITRPPEWSADAADGSSENESSYDSEDELDGSNEDESQNENANDERSAPERGILMSFPHLELYGVELMELVTLSVTVKCDRCKTIVDVPSIRDSKVDSSAVKTVVCKKCSNQLTIGYRMDLMHVNCTRAGYLDLDGCTVVDMLPSYFVPTCGECSTPYPTPGIVSVRGESNLTICRQCHKRMSFKIPEIKFLQVSAAAVRASQAPRKKKERLGIKVGEQLPNRGRCSHYAKSFRWFRFSCCSKVFPCDRCHDAECDHPNEHANRMICGYCSREQNYRPEDCGVCHSSLIAKRGTGFWEGGKGTRDKTRMSRKDPRKYKRRPGTVTKT